ncbi:hypothetical protein QTH87_10140 [Variovorax sp. J22P168]|uniref:hypothetical protein n=1 Tax=Variovorax jilinensis TaxID=3053513 RepID=UPI002575897B|nr:hypothetical protein [Variovorax sp. J22P168]MDM0012789.1 hypothetical protein [Variovorax sp. J22P168]
MRAILLLLNIAVIAAAYYLAGITGLVIAALVCFALIAGAFVFSMARADSQESSEMRRAMGRNTTFLAGLFGPTKR